MAWEWVSPVVTGAVGITGTVATLLVARTSRDAARDTAQNQRAIARDERKAVAIAAMLTAADLLLQDLTARVYEFGSDSDSASTLRDFSRTAAVAAAYGDSDLWSAVHSFDLVSKEVTRVIVNREDDPESALAPLLTAHERVVASATRSLGETS